MILYFFLFYGSFLASLFGTSLMIKVCRRFLIFDRPGAHKGHDEPVPTLGGIPVFISFIVFLWCGWYLGAGDMDVSQEAITGLSLAGLAAVLTGVYDDLVGSSPLTKIVFQIGIALILYSFGFSVEKVTNPFGDYFDPSVLKLPITIIWVLVITNAINLIDGMDGLASGIVFLSSFIFYLIVAIHGGGIAMYATLILCGSALGFLRYNFLPAKIFLGDTGSLFMGVTLAAISVIEERKGTVTITLMLPIVIMAVPIADTVLVFIRRLKRGDNPFSADRGHIHHRLLDIGFSEKQVVFTIYGICGYLGVAALLLSVASKQIVFIVLLILGAGFFISLLILKYLEDRRIKVDV